MNLIIYSNPMPIFSNSYDNVDQIIRKITRLKSVQRSQYIHIKLITKLFQQNNSINYQGG